MKHPLLETQRPKKFPALLALAILVGGPAATAAVTVNSTVVFGGGIYTYSYTVTNFGTTHDLAIVDIPVGDGLSINNLTAPTGFAAIADGAPVNLVSFFEDSDPSTLQRFAPDSTSASFSYDSVLAPSVVTFSALDANGDTYTGSTVSAVPEPSSLLLLGTAALPLLISRRRRHNG